MYHLGIAESYCKMKYSCSTIWALSFNYFLKLILQQPNHVREHVLKKSCRDSQPFNGCFSKLCSNVVRTLPYSSLLSGYLSIFFSMLLSTFLNVYIILNHFIESLILSSVYLILQSHVFAFIFHLDMYVFPPLH